MRKAICCILLSASICAQAGDKRGEKQPDPPKDWDIPPAPVLSPADALKSFRLAPGFKLELVAAEPLVEDPIAMAFDGDGRVWVVEMRAFMPNVDGTGEHARSGVIAVLEDTDGDGRMDKRTEFADDLRLPRAIAIHRDGALFIEPPYLRWFRDTDGDLEWDEDAVVSYGFGGLRNLEHAPNGLIRGLDNWIYLAAHGGRFRRRDVGWVQEPTASGGQWGLSQDDWGRLFFNQNSNLLRGNAYPPSYAVRNPNLGNAWGTNLTVARDQTTWPARINPGVNRGYRPGVLRKDGTLARVTAACGPTVFRGDAYGSDVYGDAFVCEPSGNLVKRKRLSEDPSNGSVTATNAHKGFEFLASTDERFRPVNLYTGPDGCLWIVDMYRGILQHRLYVTTYLRKQIIKRGLDKPLGRGRIWRVVPDGFKQPKPPRLNSASPDALVAALTHPNGWWRDTAQRLLVERRPKNTVSKLRDLARDRSAGIGRLHGLWTLEGIGALDATSVLAAIADPDPKVQAQGLRLAENLGSTGAVRERVLGLSNPPERALRRQLLHTLGTLGGDDAERAMERVLRQSCETRSERDAAVSGLWRRELEFLERLSATSAWAKHGAGRKALVKSLAACVITEGNGPRIRRLIDLAMAETTASWQRRSIVDGIISKKPRALRLDVAPSYKLPDRIASFTTWPGKADWEQLKLRPLDAREKALFEIGRQFYGLVCRGCHQANGAGMDSLAPPLRGSEWVTGPPSRLVRILVNGVAGPIQVRGKAYDLQMPGLPTFSDQEVAGILTFIRRSFGHEADPVSVDLVTRERKALGDRTSAWSADELKRVK